MPAIAIWESKFHYQLWRPVRSASPIRDGSDRTATVIRRHLADAAFKPLGAPASNLARAGFHAAIPDVSLRPRRNRRRAVPDPASVLRHRRHHVHIRFRRIQRRNHGRTGRHSSLIPRTSRRCRRPRKRTARAESISASTGTSTRPQASNRAGRSRTTFSRTRFANRVGSDPAWLSNAGSDRQL